MSSAKFFISRRSQKSCRISCRGQNLGSGFDCGGCVDAWIGRETGGWPGAMFEYDVGLA